MIAAIIREHVRRASRPKEDVCGPSVFEQHLAVVPEYAFRLAECVAATDGGDHLQSRGQGHSIKDIEARVAAIEAATES